MPNVIVRQASEAEIMIAMKRAQASLDIEGLQVSAQGDELIRRKLRGEISHQDFLRQCAELANRV